MSPQTYWCLLQKLWKRLVLLFKGGIGDSRGMSTKGKPWPHQEGTLARPWACLGHGWHLSMHTWAPRHVWHAPHGCKGTGPGVAYPLPASARGRLNLMQVNQLMKPWAQCHGLMGHQTSSWLTPWCLRTVQRRNAMARRYEDEPDEWKQQAQVMGTLTWHGLTHQCGGRHTDALDLVS